MANPSPLGGLTLPRWSADSWAVRMTSRSMSLERSPFGRVRVPHPYQWLLRRRHGGEDGSAFAFGVRLLATVALTFAVTGITGYVLLERNMAQRLIDNYAEGQRADASAFALEGTRATSTADGIGDIARLLEGVEQRRAASGPADRQPPRDQSCRQPCPGGHGESRCPCQRCVGARQLIRRSVGGHGKDSGD